MRAAEEAAFARGVEVEALMDKAGTGVAQAVTRFFRKPGKCIVFAGKGNNAGDALVAAERLRRLGWNIEVRLAFQEADCSGLMRKKLESLRRRRPEILGATPPRDGGTDLGVILVELWAEAADQLSAAQERCMERAGHGSRVFSTVCSDWARNRRCVIRFARPVGPSIICGQPKALMCSPSIFQPASTAIWANRSHCHRDFTVTIDRKTRIGCRRRAELRGQVDVAPDELRSQNRKRLSPHP